MQYVHALHDGPIIQRRPSTQLYFTCQGDTLANANSTSLPPPTPPIPPKLFFACQDLVFTALNPNQVSYKPQFGDW